MLERTYSKISTSSASLILEAARLGLRLMLNVRLVTAVPFLLRSLA